jgi:chitinase
MAMLVLASCGNPEPTANKPWFGGYVNATAYPVYDFAAEAAGRSHVVLGFVVADPEDACTPSWGGYYGLEDAATDLDLDSRMTDFRDGGGEVAVSFGGAAQDELATACTDTDQVYEAYRDVVDRYGLDTVDFDIEMNDLENHEANTRRAEAVARLQGERSDDDPLEVWLTLPTGLAGLEETSQDVVAQMLGAGVELAGVNIMTMNFDEGKPASQSEYDAATEAARSVHAQVKELYAEAGQQLSDELAWNRMGLTPMIGQNDVSAEVLDVEAAEQLNSFAREQGLGRVSFWSLNRDRACGAGDPDLQGANDFCSGIEQDPRAFTRALGAGFDG